MDVRYAGNEGGPPSDLDWGELGNYGTDSEVDRYHGNREGAGDYEGLQSHADVEAFKVLAEEIFSREKQEKFRESLNNYGAKCRI